MTIITIYSLFGSDVNALAFSATADVTFWILSSIALFAFSVEIILASISKEDYFLGFYFWLDLIATISLISDIGWIMDAMLGIDPTQSGGENAKQAAQYAKAS
jgi:hypothetical protein